MVGSVSHRGEQRARIEPTVLSFHSAAVRAFLGWMPRLGHCRGLRCVLGG